VRPRAKSPRGEASRARVWRVGIQVRRKHRASRWAQRAGARIAEHREIPDSFRPDRTVPEQTDLREA